MQLEVVEEADAPIQHKWFAQENQQFLLAKSVSVSHASQGIQIAMSSLIAVSAIQNTMIAFKMSFPVCMKASKLQ